MFEIAKVGHQRFAKTFKDIRLGKKWAKKIEHEIDIGSYEDLTLASNASSEIKKSGRLNTLPPTKYHSQKL